VTVTSQWRRRRGSNVAGPAEHTPQRRLRCHRHGHLRRRADDRHRRWPAPDRRRLRGRVRTAEEARGRRG